MSNSLKSLLATGTRLWLDSIDPELITRNRAMGVTGATSNPIIIADLLTSGRFDGEIASLLEEGSDLDDTTLSWHLADLLVRKAQDVFLPVWRMTRGDDGYVSFELDPLIEDPTMKLSLRQRVEQYIHLGRLWANGHPNRMIKVPATEAGIAALEDLVAVGVTVNVTLIFTTRQYRAARDAVWRGAKRRQSLDCFKSVYSMFVSRIDVYTANHAAGLSDQAQGQVGILSAKQIWLENQKFWQQHATPLAQEIVFASTGVKNSGDPPWKYVQALAGGDIQTNPPATNDACLDSGRTFTRQVDRFPSRDIIHEIERKVDFHALEQTLMEEGIEKFVTPQKSLVARVAQYRKALA